jgi:DNA-binding MarR family transcriptional regulator
MSSDLVLAVLTAYPQVYHACHYRHPRARTNPGGISARDSWILGHLHPTQPASPARLAAHLSLRPSTVSEAVKRLERLGYVIRRRADGDGRRVELFLAPGGTEAMKGASVLDAERVRRMLAQLSPAKRAQAVEGLTLLAEAARTFNAKEPKRWDDGGAG